MEGHLSLSYLPYVFLLKERGMSSPSGIHTLPLPSPPHTGHIALHAAKKQGLMNTWLPHMVTHSWQNSHTSPTPGLPTPPPSGGMASVAGKVGRHGGGYVKGKGRHGVVKAVGRCVGEGKCVVGMAWWGRRV